MARAKVSANRVATVVANEWKDGNDKVMPVKQWLEERRFFQASKWHYAIFSKHRVLLIFFCPSPD